ncbi:MAG: PEP-CTERM sorting domain-containing protein [Alphaproteobacteria bacterium]|nr:MAG: PEP-CTERM sorting domain-containing protein [Alphaproteobacteria bacterium]
MIDGNTYTTDSGALRYNASFDANCSNECIGNNSDLGWIDIVLGAPATRVGALVGGANTSYNGFVEFFDVTDSLLGTINFGNNNGLVFAGWEDAGGIARVRVTDTAQNSRIVHMEDFRFERGDIQVPAPVGLGLLGLGLAAMGLGVRRRRKS